jgi:hypothetical protein
MKTNKESLIMSVMSAQTRLLIAIATLALVSPVPIHVWELKDSTLERVALPSGTHTVAAETSADFDHDGVAETLTLTGGRAVIQTESRIRWQSPQAWRVEQTQITDLNRDGLPEAALLVWRPFAPWPVDEWLPNGGRINDFHDSRGLSCHIILIGWYQNSFREHWAGSSLAEPINSFMVADLKGNGQQYLVTLEGEYDDQPSAPSRRLKVWEWNGFGFTIVSRLEGPFSLMVTARAEDGRVLILAD